MKLTSDAILAAFGETLRTVLGRPVGALTCATRPEEVDGWDSLAHIQLVLALGARFGVKFTTQDVLAWDSVGAVVASIERKLA